MPIESELIPQEATQYLNNLEVERQQQGLIQARTEALGELLAWCNQWFEKSKAWRKASYEQDWELWRRNSDSMYDPNLAKKKKAWQSKAFVDLTPSHRETIQALLYKLVIGSRPILEVKAGPSGDPGQGEDVRDLILREMEKSRFEVAYNDIQEDSTTYGSGFCRIWHETRTDDRKIRQPIFEPVNPLNPMSVMRSLQGQQQVLGYQDVIQPVLIYKGVRIQHIPILDFFPDPKALAIKGNPMGYRFSSTYEEILKGAQEGYYLPEAAETLKDERSEEIDPDEKQLEKSDRGISDVQPERTAYGKKHMLVEIHARLPKKWVLVNGEPIDDPDKLIPARIIFHKKTVCAVEVNEDYEGEAPYLKLDYMRVNGRFYARGIPEMLKHPQNIVNEVVNQRLDEGNLVLNESYAVIEKALVNPKELTEAGPGQFIRLDAKVLGPNGDVKNAIMPLGKQDIKRNAGFGEVIEWERMAQERTSANRATLGTIGQVNDSALTLGGQQLLKEQAHEKFAYIGMVQEFSFLNEVFRAYWKLIYANIEPDDIVMALGLDRAMRFQLMSPEEIEKSYRYDPQGIFEMENRGVIQSRLQAIFQQFAMAPFVNPEAFFDKMVKGASIDPNTLKLTPEQQQQAMMLAQAQLAQQPKPEEKNGPRKS